MAPGLESSQGSARAEELTAKFANMQREVLNELQFLEMRVDALQMENGKLHEALAAHDAPDSSGLSKPLSSAPRRRFSLQTVHSTQSRITSYNSQAQPGLASNTGDEMASEGAVEAVAPEASARRAPVSTTAQVISAGMRARRASAPCLSGGVGQTPALSDDPTSPSLPIAMLPMDPLSAFEKVSLAMQQVQSVETLMSFQAATIDAEAPAAQQSGTIGAIVRTGAGQSSTTMRQQLSRHLVPAITVSPLGNVPLVSEFGPARPSQRSGASSVADVHGSMRSPPGACASDSPWHSGRSDAGASEASFTSESPEHTGFIAPRVQTWSAGERVQEFDSFFPANHTPFRLGGTKQPILKGVRPRHLRQGGRGICSVALGHLTSMPLGRQNDDSPSNLSRPTVRSILSDTSQRSPLSSRISSRKNRSKHSGDTEDSRIEYELLPTWSTIMCNRPTKRSRISVRNGSGFLDDEKASASLEQQGPNGHHIATPMKRRIGHFVQRHMMMYPSSPQCILWDVVSMLLVCYDLVLMPLQVFDPPFKALTGFMEVFARFFWTLTVPRSFFVGYMQKDGEIEMTPSKVMRNYMCGWMCFDSLIAIGDWAAVVMEGMDFIGAVRVTKVVRFLRIVRIMRVARVLKMPVLFENFIQRFHSEKLLLILGIAKYSSLFVVLCHWIACAWFAIGTFLNDGDLSWTRTLSFADEAFSYKYTTSCHWAITQFIGSMEVHPYNVHERTFAVCTLVVSFIGSAAFISRITASMTRLQIIAESTERQMNVMRNFLHHHKVSPDLTMRVIRSARFALELHAKNIVERDIELLGVISEPLRVEIHYQIYTPVVKAHPFFRHYHASSAAAMQKLCHSAIQVISLSLGDMLFTYGETPRVPQMFFLMSGCLVYKYQSVGVERMVGVGMWACEAALWVPWIHLGDMSAGADCGVLGLDAAVLQEVSVKFQSQALFSAVYASKFVNWVNEQQAATDLPHTHDCEACVASAAVQANEEKPRAEASQAISRRVSPQAGGVQSAFGSFWR